MILAAGMVEVAVSSIGPRLLLLLLLLACLLPCILGLDNGAAALPPMGMSTWDAFGFNVSSQKLMEWADRIVEYGLRDAGYNYLLLDDGWTTCQQ
jgi:alpha-galactosidase